MSRSIAIPSPEEVGIAAPSATQSTTDLDWNNAYRRLKSLNADFQLRKQPQGGFRFTCLMPTSQPDRIHRVEAEAASEAEAVRLTLERAEKWARGQ